MTRELDEQCARALGWKRMYGNLSEWYAPDGTYLRQDFDFCPSEWSDDACLLLFEVARRGLQKQFVDALAREIGYKNNAVDGLEEMIWSFLTAAPQYIASAFVEAVPS